MAYANCGAFINGRRPASKKALKEALRDAPATVEFDGTSGMGPQCPATPDAIPAGLKLQVTGPDPYTKRVWYATVERTGTGALRVS